MQAESIDDQVADHILTRFQQDVKPRPGSRYFLVRETIRAGAISYALKRDDLAKLGMELIPIPAMGGCVIAIREIARPSSAQAPRLRIPWLNQVKAVRAELRVRSVLRTMSLAHTGGDA